MLGCVEPLVATILSATVLGQAFGMIDVVGILCIVGAVTALTVVDAESDIMDLPLKVKRF